MSDDEGYDEVEDMVAEAASRNSTSGRNLSNFAISGWDNEDDGIEKDPNPHETPDKELLWAAEHSVIQVVRRIVEQNPEAVHAKDKDGYTPLHRACYSDHVDIARFLVMSGAKLDAETNEKWQPLHSACHWNSLKCAAMLISMGADINAKSEGGLTPLHIAAQRGDSKDLIQLLLSQPELKPNEVNKSNDTPRDIARRSGPMEKYFEGWNEVGFHGSEIPTPNLDALAYSGTVFRRHYAQPTCTPSRTAFLTGKYPIRFGLQGHPIVSTRKEALPTDVKLMPQVLKELGYRTHLVGKWHLGYATWSHMPTRRGFDSFFGYLNGYLSYYDGVHYDPPNIGLDLRSNEEEAWPTAYGKFLPEVLCNRAEDIIKDHGNSSKDEPLFLMVATNAPHHGRSTPWLRETTPYRTNATDFIQNPYRRVMADVMRYVDETMGNLTTALKSAGMLDNTLILFMSDNGGNSSPEWEFYQGSSNYPFRGAKFSVFEGGVRVPAVLWMSAQNFSTPRIYEGLFHLTDWLPTLNSAAGGKTLEGLDGVDQWSALTGNSNQQSRQELLVEIGGDTWAYMMNDLKFVKTYNSTSTASFTNNHFSPPIQINPVGYQIADVLSSPVATNLGVRLDTVQALAFRDEITVKQICSSVDQIAVASIDCSQSGCLYNVSADPSECYDLSDQFPDVKIKLMDKIDEFKRIMVPSQADLPPDNHPNSRNYYSPSSASQAVLNLAAFVSITTFFINQLGCTYA